MNSIEETIKQYASIATKDSKALLAIDGNDLALLALRTGLPRNSTPHEINAFVRDTLIRGRACLAAGNTEAFETLKQLALTAVRFALARRREIAEVLAAGPVVAQARHTPAYRRARRLTKRERKQARAELQRVTRSEG